MATATTLTIDAAPEDEPISVAEAKRHLRILSPDIEDGEVLECIVSSREWAESWVSRTLRDSTRRVQSYDGWPCSPIRLEYPPLLGVTSIDYYDIEDADQELGAVNYRVYKPTDRAGYVEWTDTAILPNHFMRNDAVRITYTSGYAGGSIPTKAKQAILLMMNVLWGDMSGRDLVAAERAAKTLLDACDWGHYA